MRATSIGHAGLLVESDHGSLLCDPWFVPAFFGSWFVFPRNDQLSADLLARIEAADHLYISHLHADHLDEAWLRTHLRRDIPVLVPGFPTDELARTLQGIGFTNLVRTVDGETVRLGRRGRLEVAIHCETSVSDGPQGDSALVVSDGETRLLNQNDCRPHDLRILAEHGPIDVQWLQYSGAIWYPMVYDEPADRKRALAAAKVEAQFARAVRYVRDVGARAVVPAAGPPAFLDPDLFAMNVIDGSEISIFPDQAAFLRRLANEHIGTARILVPGSTIEVTPTAVTVTHPLPDESVEAIFTDKRAYLERYQADWAGWLAEHKATWHPARPGLVERMAEWFEPLLDLAPHLRTGIGAPILLVATGADAIEILVDVPGAAVREWHGEAYGFRFEIDRRLIETVVDRRAVDWSNALFLSCRFRAWRPGPFNEYVYNLFKSLSPERIARAEAEAAARIAGPDPEHEEIELGGYLLERYCPHRNADLTRFGTVDGSTLTCTLHGWQFDLDTGTCLTAADRKLRVRRP